jgi:hypothetical protein
MDLKYLDKNVINLDKLNEDFEPMEYPDEIFSEIWGSLGICINEKGKVGIIMECNHCRETIFVGINEIKRKGFPLNITKNRHKLYIGHKIISGQCPCHNYRRINSRWVSDKLNEIIKFPNKPWHKIMEK